MDIHSSDPDREVRLEFMRPGQIDAAIRQRPTLYVPFGAIEWHGRQNAVGLDALKPHEQLVRLARKVGGVVYPPVYLGAGGGHGSFPYTHMVDPQACRSIVATWLRLFERDGFREAILLSGHYPNPGEYLVDAVKDYRAQGGKMRIMILQENQIRGITGHHAGRLETSLMMYLHPQTVDLTQLAGRDGDRGGLEDKRDWMAPEQRDHPCWGIVDVDPRGNSSAEFGQKQTERLLEVLMNWLGGQNVQAELIWTHTGSD